MGTVSTVPGFAGIRTIGHLLERVPGGSELRQALTHMRLWSGDHPGFDRPPSFPQRFSDLDDDQLGDLASTWAAARGRAQEILGVLEAVRARLQVELRRARSAATRRLVADLDPGTRLPAQHHIAAQIDADEEVLDAEDALVMVESMLKAVAGYVQTYDGYCQVISREITRRGDLRRSGL